MGFYSLWSIRLIQSNAEKYACYFICFIQSDSSPSDVLLIDWTVGKLKWRSGCCNSFTCLHEGQMPQLSSSVLFSQKRYWAKPNAIGSAPNPGSPKNICAWLIFLSKTSLVSFYFKLFWPIIFLKRIIQNYECFHFSIQKEV